MKGTAAVHPPIDNVVQKAYAALKTGKLMGLRCRGCQTYSIALAGYSCRHCGSFDLEWVELGGQGKLLPAASIVYSGEPFLCGVIELDEGPLLTARIYDVPGFDMQKEPERIFELIGMRLKMSVRKETITGMEAQYCICFVPDERKGAKDAN